MLDGDARDDLKLASQVQHVIGLCVDLDLSATRRVWHQHLDDDGGGLHRVADQRVI